MAKGDTLARMQSNPQGDWTMADVEATASAAPCARRAWWAFCCLTATLLLAADFGGACQAQAQAPGRAALPGVGPFAPLQPEPGDIWAEVRGWHESQRTGLQARTGASERRAAPATPPAAKRPAGRSRPMAAPARREAAQPASQAGHRAPRCGPGTEARARACQGAERRGRARGTPK